MFIKNAFKKFWDKSGEIDIEEIYSQIEPYKYVSFDIFDTLVKRNVEEPTDIFKIMELTIGNDFALKRIEAECSARKTISSEEITFEEIYKYFPNRQELEALELEIEFSAIVPNIPIMEVYRRCVESGKKIFITTDMYWFMNAIQRLLSQVGVNVYEKIYLSSKEQKTKRTGSLFEKLLYEQGLKAEEVIHIGNHIKSDYIVPKRLGIVAIKIPTVVSEIEFKRKTEGIQNNYMNHLITNTYLGNKDDYYKFGYSQLGKLLWGYSNWLHEMAVQKNIKDLFFLARDGWLMKQAYDNCIDDKTIHTHYLEVSRRSLRVPILWTDFEYGKILDMVVNTKQVSIKSIFEGLGLELGDFKDELKKYQISEEEIFERSKIRENRNLEKLLLFLKNKIIENSEREYEALASYLMKEDVKGKFGVVDIGYAGSMQRYLQSAMNTIGIENEIIGLYLCLTDYYKKNDSIDNPLDMYGYLFDFKHDKNAVDTRNSYVGLFEMFFLESKGSVKRYIQSRENVVVDRFPYENLFSGGECNDRKIKSFQQGALDFVNVASGDCVLQNLHFSVNDLFYGIYETGTNPTLKDLDLFGKMKFYDEGIIEKLADPKKLTYYINHVKELKNDFLSCRWKIGFMKKLFKINLPYKKIYEVLQRYR